MNSDVVKGLHTNNAMASQHGFMLDAKCGSKIGVESVISS
jgi:hypothetical protein